MNDDPFGPATIFGDDFANPFAPALELPDQLQEPEVVVDAANEEPTAENPPAKTAAPHNHDPSTLSKKEFLPSKQAENDGPIPGYVWRFTDAALGRSAYGFFKPDDGELATKYPRGIYFHADLVAGAVTKGPGKTKWHQWTGGGRSDLVTKMVVTKVLRDETNRPYAEEAHLVLDGERRRREEERARVKELEESAKGEMWRMMQERRGKGGGGNGKKDAGGKKGAAVSTKSKGVGKGVLPLVPGGMNKGVANGQVVVERPPRTPFQTVGTPIQPPSGKASAARGAPVVELGRRCTGKAGLHQHSGGAGGATRASTLAGQLPPGAVIQPPSGAVMQPARPGSVMQPARPGPVMQPARPGPVMQPARPGPVMQPARGAVIMQPAPGAARAPALVPDGEHSAAGTGASDLEREQQELERKLAEINRQIEMQAGGPSIGAPSAAPAGAAPDPTSARGAPPPQHPPSFSPAVSSQQVVRPRSAPYEHGSWARIGAADPRPAAVVAPGPAPLLPAPRLSAPLGANRAVDAAFQKKREKTFRRGRDWLVARVKTYNPSTGSGTAVSNKMRDFWGVESIYFQYGPLPPQPAGTRDTSLQVGDTVLYDHVGVGESGELHLVDLEPMLVANTGAPPPPAAVVPVGPGGGGTRPCSVQQPVVQQAAGAGNVTLTNLTSRPPQQRAAGRNFGGGGKKGGKGIPRSDVGGGIITN